MLPDALGAEMQSSLGCATGGIEISLTISQRRVKTRLKKFVYLPKVFFGIAVG
jgi:hypothetical protein